ncbi:MAG: 4Fe-4S binding protein, partial [Vicinamibacteria bacterium]
MAARVVEVQRKKLTLLERLYVLEIIRGLGVTLRHLALNLWGFVRRRRNIFTVYYPEERYPIPPAFRGMPVLVEREDGTERCVACGLCEVACPTHCIF